MVLGQWVVLGSIDLGGGVPAVAARFEFTL
jgi:hypothetical protein